MDESTPVSSVKRRRRPAKSCNPCRLRKLKCDLGQPCGTCKRARASINCTYKSDSRTNNAKDGTPTKRVRLNEGSRSPTDQDLVPNQKDGAAEQSRHSPTPIVGVTAIGKRTGEPEVTSRNIHKQPPLRLRNGRDKTKLFGPSHWIHMAVALPSIPNNWDAKEADFSFDEHNINGDITDVVDMFVKIRKTRHSIRSKAVHGTIIQHELLAGCLPGTVVSNELISYYVDFVQPIYRLLHVPSFYEEYRRFRNEPESSSITFIMQLGLVLAIGSTFYSRPDKFQVRDQAQSWILAAQSWIVGPGSKTTNTISGLQIYILLLLSKQTTCNSGGLSWISTGSLITMAMSMGLHHDLGGFASLTPFQSEMRKRLWVVCLELCVQHHIDSTTPMLLNESDIVIPEMINVNDESISLDSEHAPNPEESFTDASIQIQFARSLALRLKIGRLLNGMEQNYSFGHVLELGQRLRDNCRELSQFFSPGSTTMPGAFKAKAARFHDKFLNTLLRRYIILLHQQYMVESVDNPTFFLARKICVDAARAMVEDLSPSGDTTELIQLAAAGRGTFKGAFSLNVILVLSLELFMLFRDDNGGNTISSRVDSLDVMRGDARDSVRNLLQKLASGARELMRAGNVSSKAYNFITAVLAETDAIERSQCTKTAVFNGLRISLKETLDIFRELHSSQITTCNSSSTVTELDNGLFDLESFDLMNWDISDLLYMPGLDN